MTGPAELEHEGTLEAAPATNGPAPALFPRGAFVLRAARDCSCRSPNDAPKDAMSEPQIVTLGCRLNAYESEVMRRHAARRWASRLRDRQHLRCDRRSRRARPRQTIRKLRRDHPTRPSHRHRLCRPDRAGNASPPSTAWIMSSATPRSWKPATFRALADRQRSRASPSTTS